MRIPNQSPVAVSFLGHTSRLVWYSMILECQRDITTAMQPNKPDMTTMNDSTCALREVRTGRKQQILGVFPVARGGAFHLRETKDSSYTEVLIPKFRFS